MSKIKLPLINYQPEKSMNAIFFERTEISLIYELLIHLKQSHELNNSPLLTKTEKIALNELIMKFHAYVVPEY